MGARASLVQGARAGGAPHGSIDAGPRSSNRSSRRLAHGVGLELRATSAMEVISSSGRPPACDTDQPAHSPGEHAGSLL